MLHSKSKPLLDFPAYAKSLARIDALAYYTVIVVKKFYNIFNGDFCGRYSTGVNSKNFFSLSLSINYELVCPWQVLQASLLFMIKERAYPSGVPYCFSVYGCLFWP